MDIFFYLFVAGKAFYLYYFQVIPVVILSGSASFGTTMALYCLHQYNNLMKTTIAVNMMMILLYYFLLYILLPF